MDQHEFSGYPLCENSFQDFDNFINYLIINHRFFCILNFLGNVFVSALSDFYSSISIKMQGKKEVTYEAISSFIIAIKCCNMQEIKKYLEEYDPIIVNRLETQTRQPSIYFSASLIDHQQSYEIMKLLIEYGANPHFKDNYQQTVLFYICRDGKEKCLDLLLEQGLDLNDADLYGQTPIYYAAKQNRLNIIHKLIEKKVDLNIQDKIAGQTPLFYAAKEGHIDMCKVLIQSGADMTITDTSNKMAMHLAKKSNRVQTAEYLAAEYQTLKDLKKIQADNDGDSNKIDEKPKKKKKDIYGNLPKSTSVFVLMRSDNFGNSNQLTNQELQQFYSIYPKLEEMLKNPESIDLSQLQEVKAKDSWHKVAMRILTICSKSKGGSYFQEPVDPSKFGIDDYFEIITQPMDFSTVKKKLLNNVYANINQFIRDMHLVFDNCVEYNGVENMVAKFAIQIKNIFDENMKQTGFMN